LARTNASTVGYIYFWATLYVFTGTRFGSQELKIGSLESEKIGSLES